VNALIKTKKKWNLREEQTAGMMEVIVIRGVFLLCVMRKRGIIVMYDETNHDSWEFLFEQVPVWSGLYKSSRSLLSFLV